LIFVSGCRVEEETIIVQEENTTNEELNVVVNETVQEKNETINLPKAECRVDADCGTEKIIDKTRCWQKSIYTMFNESRCILGKCKTEQYESLTEICDERDNQICEYGKCVQLVSLKCKDSDGLSPGTIGRVTDPYGNIYNDYCLTGSLVVEFYCNPEHPEKAYNETKECIKGCERGRCNPETNGINDDSTILNTINNNS